VSLHNILSQKSSMLRVSKLIQNVLYSTNSSLETEALSKRMVLVCSFMNILTRIVNTYQGYE